MSANPVPLPVSRSGQPAIEVARQCARTARDITRAAARSAMVTGVKGRGNVVTETDFAVERAVMATLRECFPEHAVLSEETAAETRARGWMWVVDPLDGTKNFSRGIPHFSFTIALCYDGEPLLGLTTHPLLGVEVVAQAGQGCLVNGAPALIAPCPAVADAVVAMDLGYDAGRARRQLELAAHLWPGIQSLRITGSAALGFALLVAGSWDLYLHSDLQPWDVAAGLVITREAGGVVLDRSGEPATIRSRAVVAGSAAAVEDFRQLAETLPFA
jgi:fructose-1,6-bisphosphatase/inositol monophosphatase family enzyme